MAGEAEDDAEGSTSDAALAAREASLFNINLLSNSERLTHISCWLQP